MNERDSIEKKLTRSFFKVASITAAVALLGLVALIAISNRYSYALKNFGFAQGDIGKAMFEFADSRSSLRAAIGYDDADAITTVVKQHNENKVLFEEYFATIEDTIVSEDGRKTYDEISSELDAYWALDQQIMDLGATTDRELCRQAQDIALQELAPAYNSIYSKLESLLNVKVTEGNRLSATLTMAGLILSIAIVVVIAISLTLSTKIGKNIAKGIASPLGKLGKRLKTFSAGDLTSPFPLVETGDEVEHMEKDATEMANNLNIIIHDISVVLGEMAGGNYAVKSKYSEKYTGDFKKLYESMRGLRDQMVETLTSIGEVSGQVSSGSGDLADASQVLAEGATEQTNAVMELHATISEITNTMEKSAQSADESYMKAQLYADKADNSREEMNSMANQSAKAAVDTRELIEGSIREVSEGNRAAENVASAISSVVDGIKQIADFSKNLKTMVNDQTEAMREAEKGINQISEVVQSNAATAQEASATSQELSAQATILNGLIEQFSLK